MFRAARPPLTVLKHAHARRSRGAGISFLASLPVVVAGPVVFGGLVVSLWAYKCAMMVLFQNKIIYMPGVPLGARHDKVADYRHLCRGISWTEKHRALRTSDGRLITTVSASTPGGSSSSGKNHTVVVYLQGNASSTPSRLPDLSAVLSALSTTPPETRSKTKYTLLIPSYRGYWTSTGRPSQRGITRDLDAVFRLLETEYQGARVVLWGQSIGAGIALTAWAGYIASAGGGKGVDVVALILETPFVSVRRMLQVLYPQRWMPYRYLGVFLASSWDVAAAVGGVRGAAGKVQVLVLQAGRDEVVPAEQTEEVLGVVREAFPAVGRVCVRAALHGECVGRMEGRGEVVAFLRAVGEGEREEVGGKG